MYENAVAVHRATHECLTALDKQMLSYKGIQQLKEQCLAQIESGFPLWFHKWVRTLDDPTSLPLSDVKKIHTLMKSELHYALDLHQRFDILTPDVVELVNLSFK